MTKLYFSKFQIDANIPNKEVINDFINFSVNFEIICPNYEPKLYQIKKNGYNIKLKGKQQIFLCKTYKNLFLSIHHGFSKNLLV